MDMSQLERECRSYTRYLVGQAPTAYIVKKYVDFHQNMDACNDAGAFDHLLVSISARGPLWARLADSYASVWRKNSTLRKKLVLTLALLECVLPSAQYLDRSVVGKNGTILRLTAAALAYASSLAVSSVLFAPIHIWAAARER